MRQLRLHNEGKSILITSFLILSATCFIALWFSPIGGTVAITLSLIIYGLMINFFRLPERKFTGNSENVVVSSVDGTVVALEETFEKEYLHQNVIQLSVFMSIFDVHANWFPVNGEVIYTAHHPGRFRSAWLPKSSIENERSSIVIRTDIGQNILVRQVAGAMARRIVTYTKPGTKAHIEKHLGFIKFGSRVDIYLPLDTELYVKIGDKTIGGITKLGRLSSKIAVQD